MSTNEQIDDLGRLSFATAEQLRKLAEQMGALTWKPDGYELREFEEMAAALHGMAMRCAMSTGNTDLLVEVSGRPFHEVTVNDAAGE